MRFPEILGGRRFCGGLGHYNLGHAGPEPGGQLANSPGSNMPDQSSDRMLDSLPDKMSDRMPDRMSDRMSDRMIDIISDFVSRRSPPNYLRSFTWIFSFLGPLGQSRVSCHGS